MTKSSKYKNLCVAGVEAKTGKWIRLVEKGLDGAVSDSKLRFGDNSKVDILDCIEVYVNGSSATVIQPENVILDSGNQINKIGHITIEEFIDLYWVRK